MDWIVFLLYWYVEVLTPVTLKTVTVFGDRAFKEVIMIKWGYYGEP